MISPLQNCGQLLHPPGDTLTLKRTGEANTGILQNGDLRLDSV